MYATICITVIGVAVAGLGLCGYVIYLWQKSAKQETKRLYAWLDDILDRISAEDIERYALCSRIKHDMTLQQVKARVEPTLEDNDEKQPIPFVNQKR